MIRQGNVMINSICERLSSYCPVNGNQHTTNWRLYITSLCKSVSICLLDLLSRTHQQTHLKWRTDELRVLLLLLLLLLFSPVFSCNLP
jgi:hypothetical protein